MPVWRWLAAVIAATALGIWAAPRPKDPPPSAPGRAPERPWLSKQAAHQLFGDWERWGRQGPGPLFDGVVLGGPAPSDEVRKRISAFAHDNDVRIDLEILRDEVTAIRVEVVYGGCCGYEGAEVLALRLGRRMWGSRCRGDEMLWITDWSFPTDGGYARFHAQHNRIKVRWEASATLDDVLERADRLVGSSRIIARVAAGDRWVEIMPGRKYMIEVPAPWLEIPLLGASWPTWNDANHGLWLLTDSRGVERVDLAIARDLEAYPALRARWGRPRIRGDLRTWVTKDRVITAEYSAAGTQVSVRRR